MAGTTKIINTTGLRIRSPLDMEGQQGKNGQDPTAPQDLVTQKYLLDTVTQLINIAINNYDTNPLTAAEW